MRLDIDDPRWTAFALDELEPTEAAAMAALVETDPEARAAVASIRQAARLMHEALTTEPAPGLTLPPASSLLLAPMSMRRLDSLTVF